MIKAVPTVQGVVVRGTAIESVARHYCKSYNIPHGNGTPVAVGRVKYIPHKRGGRYVRVLKGRGTFIAVILPLE